MGQIDQRFPLNRPTSAQMWLSSHLAARCIIEFDRRDPLPGAIAVKFETN
jgi:hypothetical protein